MRSAQLPGNECEDDAWIASAGRKGRGGRVQRGVAFAGIAGLLVVAALVWARDDGSGQDSVPSPATASIEVSGDATAPSVSALPPATDTASEAPAVPVAAAPRPELVLEDGRHPVLLTDIDVAGSTVEFDLIVYLSGDEAFAAYTEDHPGEPDGYANDHYTINDNPRLRRLPVAHDVPITVLQTASSSVSPHPIAFADLPGYVGIDHESAVEHLGHGVFWLTVSDGIVVAIEEQYVP
jgi:hypothetical protein